MCWKNSLLAVVAGIVGPALPTLAEGAAKPPGAERFAALALECVHREYPNKISHVLAGDADVQPPRRLTPVFYGCYDWHSSVHGHWLLARFARLHPGSAQARAARVALAHSFQPQAVAAEVAYLQGAGRSSFERPYGLAWLLQLAAELRDWDDEEARGWAATLAPLEAEAAARVLQWLPKLDYPIRIGEHAQTAFAFGLIRDWAVIAGHDGMREAIDAKSRQFHGQDVSCPLAYEPSGQDFLSPCLAEADLMRRVLAPAEYTRWLSAFLPGIPAEHSLAFLEPARVSDRSDPKLAHLDGLNLSRAWMLRGMAAGLSEADPRREVLLATARRHAAAALPAVTGEHYEGGHWLGSFALYLLGGSGLPAGAGLPPAQ